MNLKRFVRKNALPILIVVIIALLGYNYMKCEGFKTNTCNRNNCKGNGREWLNNKCYERCTIIDSDYRVNSNNKTKCEKKLRPGDTKPNLTKNRPTIQNC